MTYEEKQEAAKLAGSNALTSEAYRLTENVRTYASDRSVSDRALMSMITAAARACTQAQTLHYEQGHHAAGHLACILGDITIYGECEECDR